MVGDVVKLTDFEYAKRMDDPSHHSLRTVRLISSI